MSLWFKHDASFGDHPKTLRLRRLAGKRADSAEVGWWRLVEGAKRYGSWTFEDEDHIRHVAGRYAVFLALYREVGFLDGLTIHNGAVYQTAQDKTGSTRQADYRAKRDVQLRSRILERDEYRCRYCGVKNYPVEWFVLDHIDPEGDASDANLATACRPCNKKKGSRTPDVAGMTLRDVPVVPLRDTTREDESRADTTEQSRPAHDPWNDPEHEALVWLAKHGCDIRPGNGYHRKLVTAVEVHGVNAIVGMMDRLAEAGTKHGDVKGFLFGAIDALDARGRPTLTDLSKQDRDEERDEDLQRRLDRTRRDTAEMRAALTETESRKEQPHVTR